jgi:hypothetical protein
MLLRIRKKQQDAVERGDLGPCFSCGELYDCAILCMDCITTKCNNCTLYHKCLTCGCRICTQCLDSHPGTCQQLGDEPHTDELAVDPKRSANHAEDLLTSTKKPRCHDPPHVGENPRGSLERFPNGMPDTPLNGNAMHTVDGVTNQQHIAVCPAGSNGNAIIQNLDVANDKAACATGIPKRLAASTEDSQTSIKKPRCHDAPSLGTQQGVPLERLPSSTPDIIQYKCHTHC